MKTFSEIKNAISTLSENEQREFFYWLEIELGMREMVEQAARLTQCYVIWREVANSKNANRYHETLQEYRDFFEPVAHILLWQGFFVICFQLFDERQDSKHIKFRIEQVAQMNACLAEELRKKINNFAALTKIKAIRHKVSAHRGRDRFPQQVVKDAAVVVKELNTVVFFVQDIVSTLVEALTGEKKSVVMQKMSACDNSTRDSTFQVMQTLSKFLRDSSGGQD